MFLKQIKSNFKLSSINKIFNIQTQTKFSYIQKFNFSDNSDTNKTANSNTNNNTNIETSDSSNTNSPLEGNTINIGSETEPKIETIEAENVEKVEKKVKGSKIRISDVYSIPSKKMGPPNIENIIDKKKFTGDNVKMGNFKKEDFDTIGMGEERKYIPVAPKLGPFEIIEPQFEGKVYHWCACGMSKKQPFCDGSHRNSNIRPISFKLGEKVASMSLCGCKLSKVAPFCDGKTCVNLRQKEEEEINQQIENLNK